MGSIDLAKKKKLFEITVSSSKWGGNPYTQTISSLDISSDDMVNIYPIWNTNIDTRKSEKSEYAKISMVTSANGSITLYCDNEAPTLDLTIRVEVVY